MLCQYIEMKSFNGIIFDLTDGMKMRGVKGAANGSPKNRSSVVSVYNCKEKALRETKRAWKNDFLPHISFFIKIYCHLEKRMLVGFLMFLLT